MNNKTPDMEIGKALHETMSELIALLDSIDEETLNTIPFDGSWTAGQLAEHVRLSATGFIRVINGPVKQTERAADKEIAKIKEIFLDFSSRMKSPESIVPESKNYNKKDLLGDLQKLEVQLATAIQTLDLTKTCMAFEIPKLGFLTRLEAIWFVIYHTQRHIHQLKNIKKALEKIEL